MSLKPPGVTSICNQADAGAVAAALPAQANAKPIEWLVVQADPANDQNVLIGNSTHQFMVLEPGNALVLPCDDITEVYVKEAAAGTTLVNYYGK